MFGIGVGLTTAALCFGLNHWYLAAMITVLLGNICSVLAVYMQWIWIRDFKHKEYAPHLKPGTEFKMGIQYAGQLPKRERIE